MKQKETMKARLAARLQRNPIVRPGPISKGPRASTDTGRKKIFDQNYQGAVIELITSNAVSPLRERALKVSPISLMHSNMAVSREITLVSVRERGENKREASEQDVREKKKWRRGRKQNVPVGPTE